MFCLTLEGDREVDPAGAPGHPGWQPKYGLLVVVKNGDFPAKSSFQCMWLDQKKIPKEPTFDCDYFHLVV